MNLLELRYFLAVSRHENIQRSAKELHVSAGAVSKAIDRLENELETPLLAHEGGRIHLTEAGKILARRTVDLLRLEEAARLEVMGEKGAVHVLFAGSEVLLLKYGRAVAAELSKKNPRTQFTFSASSDERAIGQVERGDVHLAILSGLPPATLASRPLDAMTLQLCAGPDHPLVAGKAAGKRATLRDLADHPFVVPTIPMFGHFRGDGELDGWPSLQAPRTIRFRATCLKILEAIVMAGEALAYLPDHHVTAMGAQAVAVEGLPISTAVGIHLAAKNPERFPWLRDLFA